MEKRPVREALHRFASEYPEEFTRFAIAIAQFEGWNCIHEPEIARQRLIRIFNSTKRPGHAPRNFDGDWVLIAHDFFPDDAIAQMHQRRASVAQIRREEKGAALKVANPERRRSAA